VFSLSLGSFLAAYAAVGQFSQDSGGCSFFEVAFFFVHNGGGGSSDALDVLQNEAPRTAIVCNFEDAEEQAASLPAKPSTAAGDAEVLARESGNDAIHLAAPVAASEGEHVRPDRRRIKGSRFHKRGKLGGSRGFPLHVANSAVSDAQKLECGSNAFSEHSDAGAQFNGRNSHMIH
jgi:hypothetical protein